MLGEATEKGLLIYPKHKVTGALDPLGKMHDSRSGFPGRFYRRRVRSWDSKNEHDKPVIHESVKMRAEGKPDYHPWILEIPHEIELWPEPRILILKESEQGK